MSGYKTGLIDLLGHIFYRCLFIGSKQLKSITMQKLLFIISYTSMCNESLTIMNAYMIRVPYIKVLFGVIFKIRQLKQKISPY